MLQRKEPQTALFRIPGGTDKTMVIGATGSGKTVFGAWLLTLQDFNKRPWVALDFKREELWDMVGDPPMRPLKLGQMPGSKGLYRLKVNPGQEAQLEDWLWRVWAREEIGLFCDEVTLLNSSIAFLAIVRQGRSKRLPLILCTQRPVKVPRELFSESNFKAVFNLYDQRDYKTIAEFTNGVTLAPLPDFWAWWVDHAKRRILRLKPCPSPSTVALSLRQRASPYTWLLGS